NKMCEVLNLSRKELLEICFNNSEKLFLKVINEKILLCF
ncbi:hypothetical protein OLS43_04210, partial [Campylobacter jejuni]|nr:hypothetical protein [Campylobacter jejuni]